MNTESILKDWQLNPGVSEVVLEHVVSALGFSLPPDYVEFLRQANGGEGFIDDNYLILWKADELKIFNEEYEVETYAPGLFLFGSDGGGEGYGFDKRDGSMCVIRVPFIGMDVRYAEVVASSFTNFLQELAS